MTLLALFRFQGINTFVKQQVFSRVFKSLVVPAQSSFFITLHIYNRILSIYYQNSFKPTDTVYSESLLP